jgi:hypothetical protein
MDNFFTKKGFLTEGFHLFSGNAFLDKFCFNDYRDDFRKSISDIFDWAKIKNVKSLFIGGSFVSTIEKPRDIDVLMTFQNEEYIPHKSELLTIEVTRFDIIFCSEHDREIVDNYLFLLTNNRSGDNIGIAQIDLYDSADKWKIIHYPDETTYEIIKRAYINRHHIDHYRPNGIVVTIHGLLSNAKWNADIAPIVSSQNWIFAPYLYEGNDAQLLIDPKKRRNVVENFRDWIYDMQKRYQFPISVIAHSFGTYIIASYLNAFSDSFSPVQFNCIILTGSILNVEFDWEKKRGIKVARVLNEIAKNDQWVKHMPNIKWLDKDELFGNSGVYGFKKKTDILLEKSNDIFDHNNVIKRDVIERHWVPYLMANRNAYNDEIYKVLLDK